MKLLTAYSLFLLLLVASGAKAQVVWKQSMLIEDGVNSNKFYATSCYKNTFYIVGKVYNNDTKVSGIRFFRSEDGGKNWIHQDPNVNAFEDKWSRSYRLQQIDSLNVVAIVDSGIIVRTFDGGSSWTTQGLPDGYRPINVHFHDSLQGIITSSDLFDYVFITNDGGRNWNKQKIFSDLPISDCHSYGGGKFSVYSSTGGIIISTNDNWQSNTFTKAIISQSEDSTYESYVFSKAKFTDSGTVFAYGRYKVGSDGVIVRTTDSGKTWEKPPSIWDNPVDITHLTNPNRDTILAAGMIVNVFQDVLISTDQGKTWREDTLLSVTRVIGREPYGIEMNDNGKRLIASDKGVFYGEDTTKLSVELGYKIRFYSYIYPNPANDKVTIEAFLGGKDIKLVDILGRKTIDGITDLAGNITFDLSTLPRGIYNVMLNRDFGFVPVGKVAVTR